MKEGDDSTLLYVIDLNKSFGRNKILVDSKFELVKGEILGFVGPSGSGKSVFLKILLGFLKADSGKIYKKRGIRMGFSSQDNPLYNYLTVEQNLQYFSKINDISRKHRKQRIAHLIHELDLGKYKKILVKNLSGGTKKRVDLACSLLEDPDVLILDEPFIGLDPDLVKQLSGFINHVNKSGVSIIISSHRVEELSKLCDRFVELEDKKLVHGTKHKVRRSVEFYDL